MKFKKYILLPFLAAFAIVLAACSSTNGTYVYKGSIPLLSDAQATLTIDGDEGKMKIEGKPFLSSDKQSQEFDVKVNSSDKTIEVDGATLKYDIQDKVLKITDDSSGVFQGKEFTKQ